MVDRQMWLDFAGGDTFLPLSSGIKRVHRVPGMPSR